ncbi:hypothetical protein HPB50_004314 [Hyalomma asiaticum]|uniref:Uncharacterized protein n=1 Tax=Hyalomma asiaticum TaxID=266040 RepID=A0ACB7RP96_HYAAI|nr:hypothetical protein HPB50_004314 [Hyalomma asiaticum]
MTTSVIWMKHEIDCASLPDMSDCGLRVKGWYFDPVDRHCKTFYYGGCYDNDNRYESEQACKDTCHALNSSVYARQKRIDLPDNNDGKGGQSVTAPYSDNDWHA